MAISKNILLAGLSGKMGNIVFRQRNGKTIICMAPTKSNKAPTHNQRKQTEQFSRSTAYAKRILRNPGFKEAYQSAARPGQTAYNRACSDASHPPVVHHIHTPAFTGKTGGILYIEASDDFKVKEVAVTILSKTGKLIEKGFAREAPGKDEWYYIVTRPIKKLPGIIIQANAFDWPGNEAMLEVIL